MGKMNEIIKDRVYPKRSGDVIMDMFIDFTFPNKNKLNNLGFILNEYFTNEFIKNEDGEDKHILVAKLNKLRNMGWDINPKINDIRIDYETYVDNAIDINGHGLDYHAIIMGRLIENANKTVTNESNKLKK